MSQWLDRLTGAGAGILLIHGEHCDDLQLLAERAGQRLDDFTHDMMSIPGHDGTRVSDSALDAVVPWLRERSLAVGDLYLVFMCQANYPEMCDSRFGHP